MWGPPQRGNHKEAEGEWDSGVTNIKKDEGNERKKDRGKGGEERLRDMRSMGRQMQGDFVHWKRS
jgi:hypothetical protein